ncbi:MAG: lamin tail domain-containing protein, partial [Thermoanaerobaculia bacterium]|nr:lamin tail domain-containing protein [Thermoanaerobaculia bacterium]
MSRPTAARLASCALLLVLAASPAAAQLVINEIDYDQVGADAAEWLELKNTSGGVINLDNYTVELVNGNGGGAAVYDTIDLPNVNLAAGDYYVICANAATVPNCDLDDAPNTDFIQNGAPDAIGLRLSGVLVDAVSYEGSTGAPYTEGTGASAADSNTIAFLGVSRFPDGTDTNNNNADVSLRCITPGASNVMASTSCPNPAVPVLVINEIDYDQAGTDTAEFIEIKNGGSSNVDLDPYEVRLVNAAGTVYQTIDLPAFVLAVGDYYVVCTNAATVSGCDLDISPDTAAINDGAPAAVALATGGTVVDTVSYEGDTPAPYTEGTGTGLMDDPAIAFAGISRFPDGTDTGANATDLSPRCISPGLANVMASSSCVPPVTPSLVINEIDYDQSGADAAEFLELKNTGAVLLNLDPVTVELVNGNGGGAAIYVTIDLPNVDLAAGDYYVICANAANTPRCDLDVTPNTDLIQNGAPDAIGLRFGGVLIDAVSYEGNTGAPYTEGTGATAADGNVAVPRAVALPRRRRHQQQRRRSLAALHQPRRGQPRRHRLVRGAAAFRLGGQRDRLRPGSERHRRVHRAQEPERQPARSRSLHPRAGRRLGRALPIDRPAGGDARRGRLLRRLRRRGQRRQLRSRRCARHRPDPGRRPRCGGVAAGRLGGRHGLLRRRQRRALHRGLGDAARRRRHGDLPRYLARPRWLRHRLQQHRSHRGLHHPRSRQYLVHHGLHRDRTQLRDLGDPGLGSGLAAGRSVVVDARQRGHRDRRRRHLHPDPRCARRRRSSDLERHLRLHRRAPPPGRDRRPGRRVGVGRRVLRLHRAERL